MSSTPHPTIAGCTVEEYGFGRDLTHERFIVAMWTDQATYKQEWHIEISGDEFTTEEALALADMIRDQADWLARQTAGGEG